MFLYLHLFCAVYKHIQGTCIGTKLLNINWETNLQTNDFFVSFSLQFFREALNRSNKSMRTLPSPHHTFLSPLGLSWGTSPTLQISLLPILSGLHFPLESQTQLTFIHYLPLWISPQKVWDSFFFFKSCWKLIWFVKWAVAYKHLELSLVPARQEWLVRLVSGSKLKLSLICYFRICTQF